MLLAIMVTGFFSCEKKVSTISYEGGTPPALSANKANITLAYTTKDQEAVTFRWTNPNYQFTTGLNSHDVSYLLEIDTLGANFKNPSRKAIGISRDLSLTITQNDLNDYLLNQMNLLPGMQHTIQVRVTSSLDNNSVPLPSNVLQFNITPYAIPPKVAPPTSGKLFITGSATPAGWMGGGDPENAAQKFTQVSPTLYVLNSIALNGGGSFLFVPQYGDWGAKYGFTGSNNTNNVNEDDFKPNGGDMLAPPVSGNYKIEVDFQRGRFKVTKL